MNEELQKIISQFKERLANGIKNSWTGGFERKFIEDWFGKTLLEFYEKGYKAGLEDAK